MASIFTYDPDPPRVSSPWATPPIGDAARSSTSNQPISKPLARQVAAALSAVRPRRDLPAADADYAHITRLEAEPQEGPTEYKLHLLLRRRRSFTQATTACRVSGSLRKSDIPISKTAARCTSESGVLSKTPPPLASTQSRQHRLEQLTTQLLWRLQQSCSYHISSTTIPVLPSLPDDARLSTPDPPPRLLPGLEESKGALYEIGVADDGTIVGLADDEMDESLSNLRAMAASLGCGVEVLRMVSVGECEWVEHLTENHRKLQTSALLVAEAHVRPLQHLVNHSKTGQTDEESNAQTEILKGRASERPARQLRISVTGGTMSGKSSLLGTLSTATLDNGRGKSRLSLLKHRHEIASGMTSSVTQELVGYRDVSHADEITKSQVVSYASGDVSSWIDIHSALDTVAHGRLVLLTDSAGHPRFHRTTVRGIVGWQPHWTLLCISADETEESTALASPSPMPQEPTKSATDLDLSQAHLQLCLNLMLPLVIAITKYDLATRAGLRQTLSRLLSTLKEAGRKPCIIHDQGSDPAGDVQEISATDLAEAESITDMLAQGPLTAVPIILTSAVKGTGINKLHAFFRRLPLTGQSDIASNDSPSPLFYIEDVYSVHKSVTSDRTAIIGGHLRYGKFSVGDDLLLGPYPIDTSSDDSDSGTGTPRVRPSSLPQSRSFPGALNRTHAGSALMRDRHVEWRRVRVTSLRNLRLPVHTLYADQVGTMGIVPLDAPNPSASMNRIRKGMVLASRNPRASKVVKVNFAGAQAHGVRGLSVGNAVILYIASVRASSKVISVISGDLVNITRAGDNENNDDDDFGFGFDEDEDSTTSTPTTIEITFQFIASKEFVEVGAKALVMPSGGPGLSGANDRARGIAGLEGFVGRIVEEC